MSIFQFPPYGILDRLNEGTHLFETKQAFDAVVDGSSLPGISLTGMVLLELLFLRETFPASGLLCTALHL